jgi:hypothetical protein
MLWPPWVRVALEKTGCSTAGDLHNSTRAYFEVARLNSVQVAEEVDRIACVAKPSRTNILASTSSCGHKGTLLSYLKLEPCL